jgi:hypothetical protein
LSAASPWPSAADGSPLLHPPRALVTQRLAAATVANQMQTSQHEHDNRDVQSSSELSPTSHDNIKAASSLMSAADPYIAAANTLSSSTSPLNNLNIDILTIDDHPTAPVISGEPIAVDDHSFLHYNDQKYQLPIDQHHEQELNQQLQQRPNGRAAAQLAAEAAARSGIIYDTPRADMITPRAVYPMYPHTAARSGRAFLSDNRFWGRMFVGNQHYYGAHHHIHNHTHANSGRVIA